MFMDGFKDELVKIAKTRSLLRMFGKAFPKDSRLSRAGRPDLKIHTSPLIPKTQFISGDPKLIDRYLARTFMHQGPVKAISRVFGPIMKRDPKYRGKNVTAKKAMSDLFETLTTKMNASERVGGTVGRNGNLVINRSAFDTMSAGTKRAILAHEAFHTVPVVGHSEILAHLWGVRRHKKYIKDRVSKGLPLRSRSEKGWEVAGDKYMPAMAGLARLRPGRFLGEIAIAGGTGYGGYKGVEAINKKRKEK